MEKEREEEDRERDVKINQLVRKAERLNERVMTKDELEMRRDREIERAREKRERLEREAEGIFFFIFDGFLKLFVSLKNLFSHLYFSNFLKFFLE